ncbi:MAG TPA: BLUF domain-containing protein [Pseudomonadales bacterium]|nr:BLUF domain-containing protein [Pseudomonadales bacterium]
MSALQQLVYVSRTNVHWGDDDLFKFLANIRPKNQSRHVTGMLLFDGSAFLQILEGESATLCELFALIQRDTRHDGIVTILEKPIAKRQFPDWSMGFEQVNAERLNHIDGLNDFFTEKTCLADIDKGRAAKILLAFEQGRWY